MCSFISLEETVQNVTEEILNILTMYDYPEIPFVIEKDKGILFNTFEEILLDMWYIQDLMEFWFMDRKSEYWKIEDKEFSKQLILDLKLVKIRKHSLVSLLREVMLSKKYYNLLLISYIKKISKILNNLFKWMQFLYKHEIKKYSMMQVHDSLKSLFWQESIFKRK